MDKYAQIEKLADLREKGVLSEEEFLAEKSKVMSLDGNIHNGSVVAMNVSGEIVYAGFFKRFVAAILDVIAFQLFSIAAGFIVGLCLGLAQVDLGEDAQTFFVVFTSFLHWMYFATQESGEYQGTIGKRIQGIKVVDMQGNRIGFGRASARYFGKILSLLVFFIGFLMVPFTEKQQALHDMLAGCLVVRKNAN